MTVLWPPKTVPACVDRGRWEKADVQARLDEEAVRNLRQFAVLRGGRISPDQSDAVLRKLNRAK
jgi:hypothetical protein